MTEIPGASANPHEASREFEKSELAGRLAGVRSDIADACAAAGRSADDVELVIVTKFHPASLVRDLVGLGERRFGESRHPESRDKAAELEDVPDIAWDFVGQIQTKKARQIAKYASRLHAIDRPELVDALATIERASPLDVFVQLNLTDDPGRGGVADSEVEALVEHVLATPALRLLGLMAVAPRDAEPERAFASVREASERVRAIAPDASALSMGMSGDFRSALSQGATHLRIGAAITGNRPVRP